MSAARADLRVTLDDSVRRYAQGAVLVGGSPLRLLRLSDTGVATLARWLDGETVGPGAADRTLVRHLLDAGLVHPLAGRGLLGPADVTLVVPVKDNAAGVARLVAATVELGDHIVVDDGSACSVAGARIRHDEPRGPAAARNTGARLARTELVAFLDSDTRPEAGWTRFCPCSPIPPSRRSRRASAARPAPR